MNLKHSFRFFRLTAPPTVQTIPTPPNLWLTAPFVIQEQYFKTVPLTIILRTLQHHFQIRQRRLQVGSHLEICMSVVVN